MPSSAYHAKYLTAWKLFHHLPMFILRIVSWRKKLIDNAWLRYHALSGLFYTRAFFWPRRRAKLIPPLNQSILTVDISRNQIHYFIYRYISNRLDTARKRKAVFRHLLILIDFSLLIYISTHIWLSSLNFVACVGAEHSEAIILQPDICA